MSNHHLTPPPLKQKDIERFHRSYLTTNPDQCWLWQRERSKGSKKCEYGLFKLFKGAERIRYDMAHRVQYFLKTGEWPKVVRHTCDNPPCVNPEHLLGGTQADNVQDMVDRGRARAPQGAQCHKARLTEDNVRFIRGNWRGNGGDMSYNDLALMFNVAKPTIGFVVTKRSWKHVT